MSGTGTLYLVPTLIGGSEVATAIPARVAERLRAITYFIAEEPKRARAFLKAVGHPLPLADLAVEKLDPHADGQRLDELLAPLTEGRDAAVLVDAGAPAVADPGATLVRRAHELRIRVAPLVGPSAILLALMAAGLEGQRFAFHGYLPVDEGELKARLRALERTSGEERRTEVFIETHYRNDRLLRVIVETCAPDTLLSVAADLSLPGESVVTRPVGEWLTEPRAIGKRPAVFLLLAQPKRGRPPRRLAQSRR